MILMYILYSHQLQPTNKKNHQLNTSGEELETTNPSQGSSEALHFWDFFVPHQTETVVLFQVVHIQQLNRKQLQIHVEKGREWHESPQKRKSADFASSSLQEFEWMTICPAFGCCFCTL